MKFLRILNDEGINRYRCSFHLYLSDKQELFFEIFDEIYMHEFLYEKELRNNSYIVYEKFKIDVLEEKVKIIKNKDIVEMGIKGLFEGYKRDFQVLFDWGEVVAISLAKAMGISAFISDDTKKFAPHASLKEELIEDVIPFAFYELLFLKYISDDFTARGMHIEFDEVASKSMRKYPMNFKNRILRTVRRFNTRYGTKRDCNWIDGYCKEKDINAQILLRIYMLERLIERISLSEFKDKYILKGGMLIAALIGVDKSKL